MSTANDSLPAQSTQRVDRVEHKYLVDAAEAARLAARLRAGLTPDPHSAGGSYVVRSLYFDTPAQKDYFAKVDGLYARQKLRLRVYALNSPEAKLECKRKQGDYQSKTSLLLAREEALAISRGDYRLLLRRPEPEALLLYRELSAGYRPAAIVEYDRAAFLWPAHHTRITLDSGVRGCETNLGLFSPTLPLIPALPNGCAVLEVKYSGCLEPFIARMLGSATRTHLSYSKYENCRPLMRMA